MRSCNSLPSELRCPQINRLGNEVVLYGDYTSGTGWKANHLGVSSGRSPREELFAEETPAHILTDDDEHLANLVAARGAYLSSSLFVRSHVDQQ
jgi:hypothetical protein